VKFHCPVAETAPPNAAFPTMAVLKDALAMVATLMLAAATDALLMVASPMAALGMVAVPVKMGVLVGAFSKSSDASAAARSVISWLMTDVKSAKCVTMSEFVELPMTMLVINVE